MIIDQLNRDHTQIHVINRAQLIDDALNLAKAGYLDYATALGMTEYLDAEDEFVPWSAAKTALSYIQLMMLNYKEVRSLVESYIFTKAVHLYDALGTEASMDDDSYFDILLREMSVEYLCGFGYAPCVEEAKKQFERWTAAEDPDSPSANLIDGALRSIFYCTAVKAGGSKVNLLIIRVTVSTAYHSLKMY